MINWPLGSGAYQYRPLKLKVEGWDVFALQTALAGIGMTATADGIFGKQTDTVVREFQTERTLLSDGIAGIATQGKLGQVLGRKFRDGWKLPNGIPWGTIYQESGAQLGNHTAPYADGSRDVGIVQRNTRYATVLDAFDAPASVMKLCERISEYHAKYLSWGLADRRAWELACGSWNAPAWTDELARGGTLSPTSQMSIDRYIAAVTKFVQWI